MKNLPESVQNAWNNREGPVVFATVNASGVPNVIYASCVQLHDPSHLIVADNYFSKTRANILGGSSASLLFITGERKAYQIKGTLEYLTAGRVFEEMKGWIREGLPGHAAVVLHIGEVYSGAERLV